jgi:hypothetical protein
VFRSTFINKIIIVVFVTWDVSVQNARVALDTWRRQLRLLLLI